MSTPTQPDRSIISTQTTKSCPSCAQLDFPSLLTQSRRINWCNIDTDYRPSKQRNSNTKLKGVRLLGFEAKWDEKCEMCNFLPAFKDTGMDVYGFRLRYSLHVFEGGNFYRVMRGGGGYAELYCEDWAEEFLVFMILPELPRRVAEPQIPIGWMLGMSFSVVDKADDFALHRRLVEEVDNRLVKEWVATCEHEHEKCLAMSLHSQENGLPYGLRVIDCKNKYVMQAPEGCEYMALSYVWGRREVFLFENRPKTIRDAMELTLRLGQQYLWVDKYCIKQDPQTDEEKEHKLRQLNAMGETYGSALATIVAVEGNGEDHGLCGISAPRQDLKIETEEGIHLRKSFDEGQLQREEEEMDDDNPGKRWIPLSGRSRTPWAKRGWTFQEGLLSIRLLFMFYSGVYFQCHTVGRRESDRIVSQKSSHWCEPPGFTSHQQLTPGSRLYMDTPEDVVLERFWACVQDYSICDLTFDEDAIVAFTGILQKFSSSPPASGLLSVPSVMGIPILSGSHVKAAKMPPLLFGLAWDFSGSKRYPVHRRRSKDGSHIFPSWTWAGWKGQIVAPLINENVEDIAIHPLASVNVPSIIPVSYLDITAHVMLAPKEKLRTAERVLAEIPMECDDVDGYLTPEGLMARNTRDAEIYRSLEQESWDIAVLFSYEFTHRQLSEKLGKYDKVFVLILKWSDKDKTKAERIGGRSLMASEVGLCDGQSMLGERRTFALY